MAVLRSDWFPLHRMSYDHDTSCIVYDLSIAFEMKVICQYFRRFDAMENGGR